MGGEILRRDMADGDGRGGVERLQQNRGDGLTDDFAMADDDGFLARQVVARALEQFDGLPMFSGCIPSTSFAGAIACWTVRASIPAGRGICRIKPLTFASAFSLPISASSASCVISSGRFCSSYSMPTDSQALACMFV